VVEHPAQLLELGGHLATGPSKPGPFWAVELQASPRTSSAEIGGRAPPRAADGARERVEAVEAELAAARGEVEAAVAETATVRAELAAATVEHEQAVASLQLAAQAEQDADLARLAEVHAGELAAPQAQAAAEAAALREAAAVADAARVEALHGRARAGGEAAALRDDLDRARGELDRARAELPQAVAAARAETAANLEQRHAAERPGHPGRPGGPPRGRAGRRTVTVGCRPGDPRRIPGPAARPGHSPGGGQGPEAAAPDPAGLSHPGLPGAAGCRVGGLRGPIGYGTVVA